MKQSRTTGSWWLALRGAWRLVRSYELVALLRGLRRHGVHPLALLETSAEARGDRLAWVDGQHDMTYRELVTELRRRAAPPVVTSATNTSEGELDWVLEVLAAVVGGRRVHLRTSGSTGWGQEIPQSAGWAASAQRLALVGGLPRMHHPVVAGLATTRRGHGLALVLSTWALGGTFVRMAGPLPTRRLDVLSGTPLQMREALVAGWMDGLAIGLLLSGSDVMTASLAQDLTSATGAGVWDSYGSTEVGSVTLATPVDVGLGTHGRVLSGVRVTVLDDEGRVVPRGTPGTLSIATRWARQPFRSDRGLIDETGRVVVLGRCDGQFNSGGVLVSPDRVRRWMVAQPDVYEARITTVEDHRFGVRLAVTFEGSAEPDDLRNRCRAALGGAHTPVRIERVGPVDS